ncbi:MAG: hypothetical protein ACREIA_09260, partial [Opitutaceae bacterium]
MAESITDAPAREQWLFRILTCLQEKQGGNIRELRAPELSVIAAYLAGPDANDASIAAEFDRAERVLRLAEDFLGDQKAERLLRRQAEWMDKPRLWSDPAILRALGRYQKTWDQMSRDKRKRAMHEEGEKARGAWKQTLGRHMPEDYPRRSIKNCLGMHFSPLGFGRRRNCERSAATNGAAVDWSQRHG